MCVLTFNCIQFPRPQHRERDYTHSYLHIISYSNFLLQIINCRFVITDSGGIQEETSYLGIPCLTLRKNTERPITISKGTNVLVNLKAIVNKIEKIKKQKVKIDKWDGKTSERILKIIKKYMIL